jgi:hypothetical protein
LQASGSARLKASAAFDPEIAGQKEAGAFDMMADQFTHEI